MCILIGRQFDKDGNLKNWWGNETIAKFIEKTNCFREKYSNFTLPDPKIKVNSISLLEVCYIIRNMSLGVNLTTVYTL